MDCDFLLPTKTPLFRAAMLEDFLSAKLSSLNGVLMLAPPVGVVDFLIFVVFLHDNILRLASSLDKDSWLLVNEL